MELSDAQFEHLVGMLADNRTGIVNSTNALMNEIEKTKRELREEIKGRLGLISSHLTALEEDVGKVQVAVRSHTEEFGKVHQALEGLTQLSKSTWDNLESLQKHVHAEASLEHVPGLESLRAQ